MKTNNLTAFVYKTERDVKKTLQFVYTEMKINTLHSTMHASKLSSWVLEYKGSMGLT